MSEPTVACAECDRLRTLYIEARERAHALASRVTVAEAEAGYLEELHYSALAAARRILRIAVGSWPKGHSSEWTAERENEAANILNEYAAEYMAEHVALSRRAAHPEETPRP